MRFERVRIAGAGFTATYSIYKPVSADAPLDLAIRLQPDHGIEFYVTFAPDAAGTYDGVLSLVSNSGAPLSIPLHGTAEALIPPGPPPAANDR